jgi:hypothetical protein
MNARALLFGASLMAAGGAFAADEIHWTITGQTSVTFDWRGPENTISYGTSPGATTSTTTAVTPSPLPFSSSGPFWEARLTGLAMDTLYYYRVGSGPERTFRTPPPPGGSDFTVYVEADIGSTLNYPNVAAVQQIIAAGSPAFVLAVGDLTYGDSHGQTRVDQHFNDVMLWSERAAYMPAWGNHEWDPGDDLRNYKGRFDLPNQQASPGSPAAGCCGEDWYWFDYGNVRFIAYPEPWSGAWADWSTKAGALMDDAQSDPDIDFIVTFGHRPAYSSGHHPGSSTLKGYLDALGASHSKYVLNLNGHSHNYERTLPQSGVVHVTEGGGGSSLEQDGQCLWLTCTQPAWSAFRAMRQGPLRLRFSSTWIEGSFICGPPGGGTNDLTCTQGSVVDSFTIFARGAGDTTAPSIPTGLKATPASSTRIDLSWNASTDDVGVSHYRVNRDGSPAGTASGTSYSDIGLIPSTTYSYTVAAVDGSGNASQPSGPVSATTLPGPLVITATEDATIKQGSPTRNFGGQGKLELDASPVEDFLVKFQVSGIGGRQVTRAVLRLYCARGSDRGGDFHRVASGAAWSESTVTWSNAPAGDPVPLASLGAVSSGAWAEVDVTSLIAGDGAYSLRVRTPSSTAADYRSSESSSPPQLVVTMAP